MMSHHITFAGFPKACAYVVAFQEGRWHVHEQDHTKWLQVSWLCQKGAEIAIAPFVFPSSSACNQASWPCLQRLTLLSVLTLQQWSPMGWCMVELPGCSGHLQGAEDYQHDLMWSHCFCGHSLASCLQDLWWHQVGSTHCKISFDMKHVCCCWWSGISLPEFTENGTEQEKTAMVDVKKPFRKTRYWLNTPLCCSLCNQILWKCVYLIFTLLNLWHMK